MRQMREVAMRCAVFAAAGMFAVTAANADGIDDYLFRYDFTSGVKNYSHNGLATEPAGLWSGYTAVNGPEGYGTAVHPCGKGTIENGDELLNADWTLAMSVKSCSVEKGVLLGLGSIATNPGQELFICSSSASGALHLGVAQRWGGNANEKNVPATLNLTGLGDTTGSFHSLVVTYTISDTTLRVYWDGVYKGSIDSRYYMSDKRFKTGFQFCSSHGDFWSGSAYSATSGNPDVAFRDVRFFTRVLGDEDIAAYASAHPVADAATCDVGDYQFRHNFTSGRLVVEGSGYTDYGMAGTGTAVPDPAGYGTATFPDCSGRGSIDGGLNRDWTAAVTFRSSTTIENAVLFCLGGTYQGSTRGFVARTSTTEGQLKVGTVQNWGSGVNMSNSGTLTGLGDTTNDFHTLVVVYSRNLKEAMGSTESGSTNDGDLSQNWVTGGFSFYWDGEWVGSLSTWNGGTSKTLMDTMTYCTLYGNRPSDCIELADASSGVAFRDFRFTPKVWTSAEAKAYTKATSPLKDYLFRYDFTTGEKAYTGSIAEPTGEWSGFTAVNGPDGYGSAVHPCGVGTIDGYDNILNNNAWSVAMCVKPGSLERGIFLGIGGTRAMKNGRELCFLSSSTPGKLYVISRQTWGNQYYNEPASLTVTGIGDASNTFHTVVATCAKYENGSAAVKVYVDGTPKGTFDADYNMTQTFQDTFCFGGPFEKVANRAGWESRTPFYDVTPTMDTAFRDLRLFARTLDDDEIAQYAEIYPAARAASGDIDDYSFRHDFSTGRLAVEGAGYVDDTTNPAVGSGTKVMGAKEGGFKYGAFPDSSRYGTIDGGLGRDWTCAMSVKPGTVAAGSGVLLCLGGVRDGNRRSLVVCSTPSGGELRVAIPQNWGSGKNTTSNNGYITGLGDTVNEYHSLVIVHAMNQRTLKSTIDGKSYTDKTGHSGVFTFYWDGEFAGTLATHDGASGRPFMDTMQYGTIFNEIPTGGDYNYQTLTDVSCGTAFQDLRFSTKVWSSAEAQAYAARFPASKQANVPGFAIFVR